GIRKASDFLMALQLTGAFKRAALPNLQVRLPALVIGGGLTAIDTATELFAFYPVQVEKTLERYEKLVAKNGEAVVLAQFNPYEAVVDDANNLTAVRFKGKDRIVELPARSMMVAAGTTPNISYEKEYGGSFQLDSKKKFFASHALKRNDDGSFTLAPAANGTA